MDAGHSQYFNADKNLNDLDIIVLAETKLLKSDKHGIEDKLNNWSIIGRYDSQDCQKHMGLILLKSKKSQLRGPIKIDHKTAKRNGSLHLEGLIVWLTNGLTLGFLYCKSTPKVKEVEEYIVG